MEAVTAPTLAANGNRNLAAVLLSITDTNGNGVAGIVEQERERIADGKRAARVENEGRAGKVRRRRSRRDDDLVERS